MNGKPSRPVLRGLGASNGARLLDTYLGPWRRSWTDHRLTCPNRPERETRLSFSLRYVKKRSCQLRGVVARWRPARLSAHTRPAPITQVQVCCFPLARQPAQIVVMSVTNAVTVPLAFTVKWRV